MTNESLQGVIDQVSDALQRRDEHRIVEAAYAFETAAMESPAARETLASALIGWLGSRDYRQAGGSWHVPLALRHDYERLEPETQRALIEAMLDAYGDLADPMGCFVISEILGRFGSEEALEMLERRVASGLAPEHYLPHAFEHFVRSAFSSEVAGRALASLRKLMRHDSEEVRGEAFTSLYRLSRSAPGEIAADVAAVVAAVEKESGVSFE